MKQQQFNAGVKTFLNQVRWLRCKNVGGVTIPGCSVVMVTGQDADDPELLYVQQADTDNMDVVVTSPVPIPAGSKGQCTLDWPAILAVTPADLGAINTRPTERPRWGVKAGYFTVKPNYRNFLLAAVLDSTNGLILASAYPVHLTVELADASVKITGVDLVNLNKDDFLLSSNNPGEAELGTNGGTDNVPYLSAFS